MRTSVSYTGKARMKGCNHMDKRVEKLLKVITENFHGVRAYENMHDGTHTTAEGKIISDKKLAKELKGGYTVTIHIMPETQKEGRNDA